MNEKKSNPQKNVNDILSDPKKVLNNVVLALGVFLFVGVMFKSVREFIGVYMNYIMEPILNLVGGPSNIFIILSAMAIVTAIYSSLIQKYLVDQTKMLAFTEKSKAIQRDMKEAQKTGNTFLLKKVEEQQMEVMREQPAMMKEQFKPMFYIVVVSIPIFMWGYYFIGTLHPEVSMVFPFWGGKLLSDPVWWTFTYWIYWYFLSSLAFSQVLRKFMNIRAPGV